MKRYLVTGGTSGIGEAIVNVLQAHGSHVTVLARRTPEAATFANVEYLSVDLSNQAATLKCLAHLKRNVDAYDGVVSNAGSGLFGQLENHDAIRISETVHLNLTSHILLARALLPGMKQRGSGTFLFMGSEASITGAKNGAVYCATKFGLRGLAQSLRADAASSGVRVCLVNPGMVDSPFFDELWFRPGQSTGQHLTVDDVARTVWHILNAPQGVVIDEITMSPQSKAVVFDRSKR